LVSPSIRWGLFSIVKWRRDRRFFLILKFLPVRLHLGTAVVVTPHPSCWHSFVVSRNTPGSFLFIFFCPIFFFFCCSGDPARRGPDHPPPLLVAVDGKSQSERLFFFFSSLAFFASSLSFKPPPLCFSPGFMTTTKRLCLPSAPTFLSSVLYKACGLAVFSFTAPIKSFSPFSYGPDTAALRLPFLSFFVCIVLKDKGLPHP